MRQSYFTFLYNECKRVSTASVDISQIKEFLKSPEGQKGYGRFCSMRGQATQKKSIKSVADVLTGISYERR